MNSLIECQGHQGDKNDVRLNYDTKDDTVVQPDIVIICDNAKLDDHGCIGVPDMAVEILSPSSILHDRLVKLQLYAKAGIREYWIVDPVSEIVHVHIYDNSRYYLKAYAFADRIPIGVLDGFTIYLPEGLNGKKDTE